MKSFTNIPNTCPSYDYWVSRTNCYVNKITIVKVPRICQTKPKPHTLTNAGLSLPIFFKIGDGKTGTPGVSSFIYSSTLLVGKALNSFSISRNGTTLYPIDDYTFDSLSGSIVFVIPFSLNETFLIR